MTKDGRLTQIEADPADLIRLAEVCTRLCSLAESSNREARSRASDDLPGCGLGVSGRL